MEVESPRKICGLWNLIWVGSEKSVDGIEELLESLLLEMKGKGRSLVRVEYLKSIRFCS